MRDLSFSNDTDIIILFNSHSYSTQTRNQTINIRLHPWKEAKYINTKKATKGEKQ